MSEELDERVLNLQQRHQRAQVLRRNEKKVERAREIAKGKLAPDKNIHKRAYSQARQIVRRRVAGQRGAEYEKLGPTEKMAIDKAVDKKQKLIKKIALRLIPKVKQAETQRLQSFMKGKGLNNEGKPEGNNVNESLNEKFADQFQKKPAPKVNAKGSKGKPPIVQYKDFTEEMGCKSAVYKAVSKKSKKSGISEEILGAVYDRGMAAWTDETGVSQQQYAFARINSYINHGKSFYNEDSDLAEHIEKVTGGYRLVSKSTGKNLGTYPTKGGAEKREKQVQFFKHQNEETVMEGKMSEAELERFMAKHKETMAKHAGNYYHSTPEHKGSAVSGYVVGHDPKKNGHVLLSVNVSHGVRSKNHDEYENHSVHEKHLTTKWEHSGKAKMTEGFNNWTFTMKPGDQTKVVSGDHKGTKGEVVHKHDNGESYSIKSKDGQVTRHHISTLSEPIKEATIVKIEKGTPDPVANSRMRKKLEIVDRDTPHGEIYKQTELKRKVIDEAGNKQNDPHKRLVGTDSLVKAYKADTPGQGGLNESFSIAFDNYTEKHTIAPTAGELAMRAKGAFAHPPAVEAVMEVNAFKTAIQKVFETTILDEDVDNVNKSYDSIIDIADEAYASIAAIDSDDEWVKSELLKIEQYVDSVISYIGAVVEDVKVADKQPVVVPTHTDAYGNTIPAQTVMRKKQKKIIRSGNVHDGDNN